ncbi:mucin-17 [Sesamum indicum]|uniref:Mucin-17 n=1 Tax=Sesamum indicum TaxID=4182 RepID=A0A6I9U3L2_SESIN|nr:mucin-17 [Sesamum indicum]
MKESSKVIMGAVLLLAITVAIVLTLVLLLLAELYCSLLLRRRHDHHPKTAPPTAAEAATAADAPSLSSFYAQGVLRAPRSFLFPTTIPENHLPVSTNHPSSALYSTHDPWPAQEATSPPPSATTSASTSQEHLIYICNPIYDGEEAIRMMSKEHDDTPFETPGTSPSRLEITSTLSSTPSSPATTPPLTPMKKLPAEGSSVSLRDARSICTTPSDSNTNNDGISSSSSGSPCTSPSW